MARSRTWNLKLNLDDFNAALAAQLSDTDIALFVRGLSHGMNGGTSRSGMPDAFSDGFEIGSQARQETEAFRRTCKSNGNEGGRPPGNRSKTQPKPMGSDSETQSEPKVNQNETLTNNQETNNQQSSTISQAMAPSEPVVVIGKSAETIKTELAHAIFERIWDRWPPTRRDGSKTKGCRAEAECAFRRILDDQMATAEELEAAADLYLRRDSKVKRGFVSNVRTFFDNQKGASMEYVSSIRSRLANDHGDRMHNAPSVLDSLETKRRTIQGWINMMDLETLADRANLVYSAANRGRGWLEAMRSIPELQDLDLPDPSEAHKFTTCGPL